MTTPNFVRMKGGGSDCPSPQMPPDNFRTDNFDPALRDAQRELGATFAASLLEHLVDELDSDRSLTHG
jgi:hypothetical protein